MEELVRYMRAMVLLQLQTTQVLSANSESPTFKPEVVLANAGFNARDIATMLGKSQAAVAKAISRARLARKSDDDGGEQQPTIDSAHTGELQDA